MSYEPEYWRITNAAKKVIAKHECEINCERIFERAKENSDLFLFPVYVCEIVTEIAKFSHTIKKLTVPPA